MGFRSRIKRALGGTPCLHTGMESDPRKGHPFLVQRSPMGACCRVRHFLPVLLGLILPALAAEWESKPWGRSRPLGPRSAGGPGFTRLPFTSTGINFTNQLPVERQTTNQIYLNGSGVALGDVDGDGRCDVFLAGLDGGSRLFRNLGDGHFADITASSGAPGAGLDATGAALADLDGDGDLDIVLNSVGGGTRILWNDGKGRFNPGPVLNPGRGGMSLALADLEGDGDLDIYVANYRTVTLRDQPATQFRIVPVDGRLTVASVNGRPTTSPDLEGRFTFTREGGMTEHGEPDVFLLNDGKGSFSPVGLDSGRFLDEDGRPIPGRLHDWGLSVTFRDFTGDGRPDLYVCNDFDSPDRIWINQGDGRFRAATGAAVRTTPRFSMGVDVADINRDGHDDLLILDMLSRDPVLRLTRMDKGMEPTPPGQPLYRTQAGRNALLLGRGDGTFAEVAHAFGIAATEWSWTPLFLDVDLDGFEDVLITAGHGRDDMDADRGLALEAQRRSRKLTPEQQLALRRSTPPLRVPRQAWRNLAGHGFEEVGGAWGFSEAGVCHGMATADLDGDGDLDLVVNELNGAAGIYRNDAQGSRVAIRLEGSTGNTQGVGARIVLHGGATPVQAQEILCGGRYLSSDAPARVFATGGARDGMEIEVRWPSGRQTRVRDVQADREYVIRDPGPGPAEPRPAGPSRVALFALAATGPQQREEPFDDFSRQPLLPRRLSTLGPGVAWADVDGDGDEDIVVGGGRNGAMGLIRNLGDGKFESADGPATERDQAGLVSVEGPGGKARILAGSSNHEDDTDAVGGIQEWAGGGLEPSLAGAWSSVGPLALGDLDLDGSPELFVGARTRPGRYPEVDGSRILKRIGLQWMVDPVASGALRDCGMVSGAIWTDVDGDGRVDLVVAIEWGALKVFRNDGGRLVPQDWGLERFKGFWNGVAAGDFDADGRMDLVASNWGLNTRARQLRLYWGDLAGQGQVELLEAEAAAGRWYPVRDVEAVGKVLPWMRERFPRYRTYAEATVERLLEGRSPGMLEADSFETSVFLNRGGRFERVPLPAEAQWAVAFGVSVGDFDGDGREDVFLAQNFFGVHPQDSRSDAGRGLVLKGDGKGGFEALPGSASGIEAHGEGRGSAVADMDGDGRLDLVIGQNMGGALVYRNVGARPGVRIRLDGPGARIGAKLRVLHTDGSRGPVRETHSGSGYWSQDGAVVVLGTRGDWTGVEVQWPGEAWTRVMAQPGTRELRVSRSSPSGPGR